MRWASPSLPHGGTNVEIFMGSMGIVAHGKMPRARLVPAALDLRPRGCSADEPQTHSTNWECSPVIVFGILRWCRRIYFWSDQFTSTVTGMRAGGTSNKCEVFKPCRWYWQLRCAFQDDQVVSCRSPNPSGLTTHRSRLQKLCTVLTRVLNQKSQPSAVWIYRQ